MTNARALSHLGLGLVLTCLAGGASCADEVGFTPRAFANYLYDSNLFRVSGKEESQLRLGTSDPSDQIIEYGAGLNYRVPVSQQFFTFSGEISRHQYDRFDFLDYTGGTALALWDWKAGTRFDGDLSFKYLRDILTFEELNEPVQDKRDFYDLFGSGNYMLTSRVQLHLAAARSEQRHSRDQQSNLDRTVDRLISELRYTSSRKSYVGLRAVARSADYPNREVIQSTNQLQDNSYKEYEYSFTVNWVESVSSSLTGRIGWTERNHDHISARDFSGVTGQLNYRWTPRARFGIDTSIWRDLDAYADVVSSYVDETGARVDGWWAATSKLTFDVNAQRENRKFDGDPGLELTPGLKPRKDRVAGYGAGLKYALRDRITLTLDYQRENRESNQSDKEFDDNRVMAGIEAKF